MRAEPITLQACHLNLGELPRLDDVGYWRPELHCRGADGARFVARMRLHLSEPLDPLLIADPRRFGDGGVEANSVGSSVLARRDSYASRVAAVRSSETSVFAVTAADMRHALLGRRGTVQAGPIERLAVTCHDPQQIGGGNTILFRYLNWLARLGVSATVYSCGRPPTWTRVNAAFRQFDSYRALATAIEEPAVLVYSVWHVEPLLRYGRGQRLISLRQGAECFHHGHDFASSRAAKPVVDLIESLTDASIVVSPYLEALYRETLDIRSHLVPNGLDLRLFSAPRGDARTGAGTAATVLSVGDPAHFLKGADVVAGALYRVAHAHPDRAFTWRIAGGAPDQPPVAGWSPPPNLSCERRVAHTEREMRDLYRAADVFVNASLTEGFGLPTLEAMACGTPVIQADNGGLTGIAVDEVNCLMVPAGDPMALAAALDRVLGTPAVSARLSQAGPPTARRFSLQAQFDAFVAAFEAVLGTRFRPDRVETLREELAGARALDEGTNGRRPALVSVVIPTYNQADYLPAALDSLIAQTYPHWEAVVVNDGSTDGTADVVARYTARDSRIRAVVQENQGITAALNAGVREACGDFFCWLSSDDLFYPDKLRLQLAAFETLPPSVALVYGAFDVLHDRTGDIEVLPPPASLVPGTDLAEALRFDFIDGCSVMIRMAALRECGGFNPRYRHAQDMELWVRLAAAGFRFHAVSEKLNVRRVHERQSSTTNMIHCRYDGAAVVAFYLDHYRFAELYPYLDLGDANQLRAAVTHAASRATHVEANVNFPLNRRRFSRWLVDGLRSCPPELRRAAVAAALATFEAATDDDGTCSEYIEACLALDLDSPAPEMAHDRRTAHRSILAARSHHDAYAQEIYRYALDLLLDERAPLFAQALTLHDTNRLVDTPDKLAHSALRYLAQFENPVRDRVDPVSGLEHVPADAGAALTLFCRLECPELLPALHTMSNGPEHRPDWELDAAAERLASIDPRALAHLSRACASSPRSSTTLLWHAFGSAARGHLAEATASAGRALPHLAPRVRRFVESWMTGWGRLGELPTPPPWVRREGVAPAVTVESTDVHAQSGGAFVLDLTCATGGRRVRGQHRLAWSDRLDGLRVDDPAAGESIAITPAMLLDGLIGSYDPIRHRATARERLANGPSVAFTLLGAAAGGGGPRTVLWLAERLGALGVDVAIYSNERPPGALPTRVRFHHAPDDDERYGSIREPVLVLYSILEWPRVRPHVVRACIDVWHLCQGLEDRHYHDGTFESLLEAKPIFELLHAVPLRRLVVSRHLVASFEESHRQEALLVENGVDDGVFAPGPARAESAETTVLVVGSPSQAAKGVPDVRQALEILRARGLAKPVTLRVVSGAGVVPPAEDCTAGFSEIHCRASTPEEMAALYRDADLVVNASWYEGFGLPTLEAMACGVPVVHASNHGLDGIVRHEENCLVVPPHAPDALADAIERILTDGNLRASLRSHGLMTAHAHGRAPQLDGCARVFERVLECPLGRRVADVQHQEGRRQVARRVQHWKAREQPLISVLVPAYNHARFLPAALDSLRAQTYPAWEAIVVDDGSTDETGTVIDRYVGLDGRITGRKQSNGGVASALNEGLRRARGEWICWLSADDLFDPDKLRIHVEAARRGGGRAFFTRFRQLHERTGLTTDPDLWQPPPESPFQVSRHLLGPYVHGNSVAVHRTVFERVGGFDETALWAQDYDMWLRVAAVEPWRYLPDRTCITRIHHEQSTRRFPEAGELEGAFLATRFLNGHSYDAVYPRTDLHTAAGLQTALRDTVAIARNPHALVHRCGFNPVLIERLAEWLARHCRPTLRHVARQELEPLLRLLPTLAGGAPLAALLDNAVRGDVNGWRFVPHDLVAAAARHAQALSDAGDVPAASALQRYLDFRAGMPIAAVPQPPADDAGAVRPPVTRPLPSRHIPEQDMPLEPELAFSLDHVRTVAVFGAGRFGKAATELADRCGWSVAYVVDNNRDLWDTHVRGLAVRPPAWLQQQPVDLVLVASQAHLEPISRQLDALGLVHGSDYVSFLAPIQVGSVRLRVAL